MAASKSSISRRGVLRTGAAVVGGGTAALLAGTIEASESAQAYAAAVFIDRRNGI